MGLTNANEEIIVIIVIIVKNALPATISFLIKGLNLKIMFVMVAMISRYCV